MTHQVRIGIIGVGNCARALLEGLAHYRANPTHPGLMHPTIGPYTPADIVPVAAWDVDSGKVGRNLWEARTAGNNLNVGIPTPPTPLGETVTVHQAPLLDGAGTRYRERTPLNDTPDPTPADITEQIRDAHIDVLLNYLPVGSQDATEWWANIALATGTAFVNNIPVFIARDPEWRHRFRTAGIPLIGDDIKSQLGATYLHRALVSAFSDRGITLDRTYQLNVGGNMDFYNMLEQDRLATKRRSKSAAVTDAYPHHLNPDDVHIGPSDYVPFLGDTKKAFIRCEGRGFGGAPIDMEVQLTVPDSPNSAGVVIDAARAAKFAADRNTPDVDDYVSAWLFKAPPKEVAELTDAEAKLRLDTWAGN